MAHNNPVNSNIKNKKKLYGTGVCFIIQMKFYATGTPGWTQAYGSPIPPPPQYSKRKLV